MILKSDDRIRISRQTLSGETVIVRELFGIDLATADAARREAAFLQTHSHPFLPRLLECSISPDRIRMVTPWIDGIPVDYFIRKYPDRQQLLWERISHFLRYLCYHDTWIESLCPEHLLIIEDEFGPAPRITTISEQISSAGSLWAAPEQRDGKPDWHSNLYSLAMIFAAVYSSPAHVRQCVEESREPELPETSPLWNRTLSLLAKDPGQRPRPWENTASGIRFPELRLPSQKICGGFLEFHTALCNTFYTSALPYRQTFELYRRYFLQQGIRKPHRLSECRVQCESSVTIDQICLGEDLWWEKTRLSGTGFVPRKSPPTTVVKRIRDARQAYEDWDFDLYRLMLQPLRKDPGKILDLDADSFVWAFGQLASDNYETLLKLFKRYWMNARAADRTTLYIAYRRIFITRPEYPIPEITLPGDDLRGWPESDRDRLNMLESLRENFRKRDLQGLNHYLTQHRLPDDFSHIALLMMDILIYQNPGAFDEQLYRKLMRQVIRGGNAYHIAYALIRSAGKLGFPLSVREFCFIIALSLDSDYLWAFSLYISTGLETGRDPDYMEQVRILMDHIDTSKLPRDIEIHAISIRILVHFERYRYGESRRIIEEEFPFIFRNIGAFVLVHHMMISAMDHNFTPSAEIRHQLEAHKALLPGFCTDERQFIEYRLWRFATPKQRKWYYNLMGWEMVEPGAISRDQEIHQLYVRGDYPRLIQLLEDPGDLSPFTLAELHLWGGLACERLNRRKPAMINLERARELFREMGLAHRGDAIQKRLDQWQKAVEAFSSFDRSRVIREFSRITDLDTFLDRLVQLFQFAFHFDIVIPFIYEEENNRFIALRDGRGDSLQDAVGLEYSHHVLQLFHNDKRSPVVFDSGDLDGSDQEQGMEIKTALCVPMIVGDRLFGTLFMQVDQTRYRFDPETLERIEDMAVILGLTLEKLYQQSIRGRLRDIEVREDFHGIVGRSTPMREVYRQIVALSKVSFPVLITGETGSGKELVARAIYRESELQGDLIALNVNAVPENLFESELFGFVKGAFSGAYQSSPGKVALAENGVLFLDEIGDLPLDMQTKLLRLIQERTYYPIGSRTLQTSSARFILATNRDLEKLVREKQFREDLYYRVNAFTIQLPPLRDRTGDLGLLVSYFQKKFLELHPDLVVQPIPQSTIDSWKSLQWPGNVRELENRVYHTLLMKPERDASKPVSAGDFILDANEIDNLDQLQARFLLWWRDRLKTPEEVWKKFGLTKSTYYRILRKARTQDSG